MLINSFCGKEKFFDIGSLAKVIFATEFTEKEEVEEIFLSGFGVLCGGFWKRSIDRHHKGMDSTGWRI